MENTHSSFIKTQVVIAGGGPTGLSMAAQLLRYNIDFIVLEKNERTTSLSKAIVVQARSLEIFEELGISEEAIRRGKITQGLNMIYKGKVRANVNLGGLGEGVSHYAMALSLEQSKTEALLLEYVVKHGKQVHWQSEISRLEQHNDHVNVYYKDAQGIEQKIIADYLVGCDGARSIVRHQLNLPFEGSTEAKLFYVADVMVKSPVINKNLLYMFMIKKGFVLFFPMEGEGHYRIVGILPERGPGQGEYTFSDVGPFIQQNIISPVEFEELRWFSTYRVHSRMATDFMQGRCFIAGDAGHIHTPAGGQGMNTGIQDGYNLAWKLAYTLKGELKADVLQSYNSERTNNAKHLLQTTDRMFDIMSGVNPFWNVLRLNVFPTLLSIISKSSLAKRKIFPLISQTGIAYPESLLTVKSSVGKVKAGDRMHYFVFKNGRHIFSYLSEPVFKLVYFGNTKLENPLAGTKLSLSFMSFTEVPEKLFGNASEFYVLLRPDNHISYLGKDVAAIKGFVSKITPK